MILKVFTNRNDSVILWSVLELAMAVLGYVHEQMSRDCSDKISGNKISIFKKLSSKPNNSSIHFGI